MTRHIPFPLLHRVNSGSREELGNKLLPSIDFVFIHSFFNCCIFAESYGSVVASMFACWHDEHVMTSLSPVDQASNRYQEMFWEVKAVSIEFAPIKC